MPRGKQIVVGVFVAHAILLCMLGADHWMHRAKKERKKLTVHTFVYEEMQKPALNQRSQCKQAAAKPAKKEPVAQAPQSTVLLTEIANSLSFLGQKTPAVQKPCIAVPEFVELQRPQESSAIEQVVDFLQKALELPEFGAVKVQLSISPKGKLDQLMILETKSQKNEQFLKKRLPELQFPCLNEAITLNIVFSNAH